MALRADGPFEAFRHPYSARLLSYRIQSHCGAASTQPKNFRAWSPFFTTQNPAERSENRRHFCEIRRTKAIKIAYSRYQLKSLSVNLPASSGGDSEFCFSKHPLVTEEDYTRQSLVGCSCLPAAGRN